MFKVVSGQENISQPTDKQKLMETVWSEFIKW